VALWGVETDYGRQVGGFPVVRALATLAWDGRRSAFFRGELLAVCYVDRVDRPRVFSETEQAAFEAIAYELAAPLLELGEARRREEYRAARDARLEEGGGALPLASSPALARTPNSCTSASRQAKRYGES